jgi:hypothetical protein
MNQPGRNRNRTWIDPQGNIAALGNVGPISNGMFVYQSGIRLTAVSATTGELLWTHDRPDIAPGGDIVSDGEVVVVWPPESSELQLFRAVDGTAIGAVPRPSQVVDPQPEGYWGARLVTLNRGIDGRKFLLGMFDPLRQESVWQIEVDGVVDWNVIEGSPHFYYLQKDQRLTVVDGWTGKTLQQWSLPEGSKAELATVWSDADRWYIATYSTPEPDRPRLDMQQAPLPSVNGVVMAASRSSGEIEWTVPVQLQRLHRDVPGRWPFLLFSSQVENSTRPERGRSAVKSSTLLLLEKASGRILFENTTAGRDEPRGWVSDPDEHRIRLGLGTGTVSLKFSDVPVSETAEEPPPDAPMPQQ